MANRKTGRPLRVDYDPATERIVVQLANGADFSLPVSIIPRVARATEEERADVAPSTTEPGIRWDALDLEIYVPLLMAMLIGEDAWKRAAGRQLGSITSAAKARASRANGAKGGRPKKAQHTALGGRAAR